MPDLNRRNPRGGEMKEKRSFFDRRLHYCLFFILFCAAALFQQPAYAVTPMSNYCIMPPYVKRDIKPNILIIMDNNTTSSPVGYGMQDPAYCTVDAALSTLSLIVCTDQYDPLKTYSGYFRSDVNYSLSSGEWTPDNTATGIFSGNILNWAATSKFDLLENILVGGRSTSRTSNPNDLWMRANSWQKTFKYDNNDGNGVRTCVFKMDSIKGLSIGETTYGACGYLDSPAHPFDPVNGQIVAALGPLTNTGLAADEAKKSTRERESAGVFVSIARRALRMVAYVMDLFSSDAEAAKPLSIQGGTATLTAGSQCVSGYSSGVITASGGSGTYSWNMSGQTAGTYGCAAGTYPIASSNTGLCMSTTTGTPDLTTGAVITGTPTFTGTRSFTLVVTDTSSPMQTDSKTYSISVTAATVTITTASPMPSGTVSVWYRESIQASGACTGTTTWTITSGSLPNSLAMDNTDNSNYTYVYGTPSSAGTYPFTVQVTDSQGNTASKSLSITIGAAPGGSLQIMTASPLPDGTVGVAYPATSISATLTPSCNSGVACCNCGWAWSWTPKSPSTVTPPGLTFNSSGAFCYNGDHTYIMGTPTTAGTYYFTVAVTDCSGSSSATKDFSLTIKPTPQPPRSAYGPGNTVCVSNTVSGTTYSCNTVRGSSCSDYSYLGGNSPCFNRDHCGTDKCLLRSGIVDQFWEQARFGMLDFNQGSVSGTKVAIPNIEYCTSTDPTTSYPDSNFLNQIENAGPIDPTTTLVNGEYSGINDYYAQNPTNNISGTGNCDPIDSKTCRQNFVLAITAGVGADNPPNPTSILTPRMLPSALMPSGCTTSVNSNLTRNACFGTSVDVRQAATYGKDNKNGSQFVNTYVVNTMGPARSSGYKPTMSPVTTGDILDQAAVKGGGKYYEVTDPTTLKASLIQAFQDIIKRAAAGTAASVLASGEGSGANLVQAVFYPRREFYNMSTGSYDEVAWVGRLTNFWYYVDPFFNSSYIREDDGDRILTLQTPAYSNPVRPGDYIVQMYFDTSSETTMAHRWTDTDGNAAPDTEFPTDIKFEGLGNLWEAGLELWKRNVTTTPRTIYTNCNIPGGSCIGSTGLMNFTTANKAALQPYLQAGSTDEASKIISWVNGYDKFCGGTATPCTQNSDCTSLGVTCSDTSLRSRTVTVNLCSTANVLCESDSDCPADSSGAAGTCSPQGTNTWKLGDVLNSTPRIASSIALNAYDETYRDGSYTAYLATGPTTTADYKDRGMVYAGANDGMMHAFYLGKFSQLSSGTHVAQLTDPNNIGFGKEIWAYIPKNALPYLIYGTDPNYGTCHIFSIDLTPVVFDASIGTAGCSEANYWNCPKYNTDGTANTAAWRTILIGGMRFGGACKQTCGDTSCVQTPATDSSGNPVGYSTYFAIDVTDQENPQLLWEFSGANVGESLGYTTAGPAIVRVNARPGAGLAKDKTRDGRWFVVFGSGPTGGIDTINMQFLGSSDQHMKLYVFDLKQGPSAGITTFDTTTLIGANAFAGSLLDASHDSDLDYQDDVVYVPYVRQCGSLDSNCSSADASSTPPAMTDGGVLRLRIKDASAVSGENDTALYPANWRLSSLIDDAGPMTSAVVRLQNTAGELWTFFGSGRYYYEQGSTVDDPLNRRRIFGVKDPCFTSAGWKSSCTSADTVGSSCGTTSLSSLLDVTDNPGATSTDVTSGGHNGWCIWLDPLANPDPGATGCTGGQWGYNESNSNPPVYVCRDYKAEREITDPLSTSSGLVFFTTYKPYSDECSLGGKSFIWAVKYSSGGAPGAMLKGVALLQVSTGSIEQVNLSEAFSGAGSAGGRKSSSLEGVPPTARGLSVMVGPPPVNRVIHMRER
jgi:hypothetical protein